MAVAEQKEQKKLGAVTYQDLDKTGQPVTVKGVTFMPGEAVNLDELFTEEEAEAMKKDLSNNRYFRVEGGPDHSKMIEARAKHEEEAQQKRAELAEKAQKQAQRGEPQPPPGFKGPDKPTLEHDSRADAKRR